MGDNNKIGVEVVVENDKGNAALRTTAGEMEKLEKTGGKLAIQYSGLTAVTDKQSVSVHRASDEYMHLDDQLTRLLASIDPAYRATMMMDQGNDLLHRGLKEGLLTQDQYQRSLGLMKDKLQETEHVTSGVSRELFVLGREVVSGNFSQVPGSLMVLANRAGLAGAAIAAISSPLGIATTLLTAGAAAWAFFGDRAEENADKSEKAAVKIKDTLADATKEMIATQVRFAAIDRADLERRQQIAQKKAEAGGFGWAKAAEESRQLGEQIAELDRRTNALNSGFQGAVERGGKDFQKFMENTGYMDKSQQKLHDLTKAADEYRAAWQAAGNEQQRVEALARFQNAEKNINEKYRDKGAARLEASQESAYARTSAEIARYTDSLNLADAAGIKTSKGQELALGILERLANGTLKLSESQRITLGVQLESMLADEKAIQAKKELIATQEHWNQVFSDGIDRQIESENALYDATQKTNEELAKTAASWSTTQEKENEDLNASLIRNDKARAKEQLRIEHERIQARIADELAGNDELAAAMDRENENYDLRIRKLDETKSAAKELGLTFSSSFEDAVVNGEKLSDVLQGLAKDIEKIILRKTVTEPIGNAIGNWFDGLDLGSIFSSSSLPSYDVGTPYVPYDQVAKIHKGERILTADENRNFSGGNSAGNVTVNIIGAPSQPQISKSTDQNGNVTMDVMFERVEGWLGKRIAKGEGLADVMQGKFGLSGAYGAQG